MNPLPTSFKKDGFQFDQIERRGNLAIYRQHKGKIEAFEVVKIKQRNAWSAFGRNFPAAEHYPASESWGTDGFTLPTLADARAKMQSLA